MDILNVVLTILYVVICVAIVVVVLMQEGKSAGLGVISGAADTYWGKNKGRSAEGFLVKATIALSTAFIVLSVVLSLSIW
ncbi:preprotein translocase subunit SecG [Lachnospiraceae bacterium KM106-2]|nr:preprotein translocase subunit SecG [Lachnospiraceae bacterium KM106-2]